jgi:hypothetical protein
MSGVISEFMVAAQPTLERMAHTFQQLKQDRDEDNQRVAGLLAGLHADRDRKILCGQSDVRAERGEKDQVNETTQGEGGYPNLDKSGRANPSFSSSETSDPARLMAGSTDAIQYCASVDTVRPERRESRDSTLDGMKDEAAYENKKKTAAFKTRGRKK